MANAVSREAYDSATISVELSGVTATPLGKAMPSATGWGGRRVGSRPGRTLVTGSWSLSGPA